MSTAEATEPIARMEAKTRHWYCIACGHTTGRHGNVSGCTCPILGKSTGSQRCQCKVTYGDLRADEARQKATVNA
jgi:hypothetical protein